jgi:hypothetical protein
MTTDPRGPIRTIVAVLPYREVNRTPNTSGGCILVVLDCGHERELNFTFSYKVGEACRCYACSQKEQE